MGLSKALLPQKENRVAPSGCDAKQSGARGLGASHAGASVWSEARALGKLKMPDKQTTELKALKSDARHTNRRLDSGLAVWDNRWAAHKRSHETHPKSRFIAHHRS